MHDRRRVLKATAAAALLGAAPSTLEAFRRHRAIRPAVSSIADTTRAVGILLPPGRPGFARGAAVHLGISVVCGQGLARTLPEKHSRSWGAVAGLAIGLINVGLIGRRFPEIRALPLLPQLADNVAFGLVFALVLDR